jgi:hypothetical protein
VEEKGRSNNLLHTGDPPHREKQALAKSERLANGPHKKAMVTILTSDKVEFKLKLIK